MRLGYMVGLKDHPGMSVPGADFAELLLFNGDPFSPSAGLQEELHMRSSIPVEFVHAQEFITHDGKEVLADISSEDEGLRRASIESIGLARKFATALGDARVVLHPGGIQRKAQNHEKLMTNLESSLAELGPSRLLLENMPWFYWHRKHGRMVSSVCVSIEDMMRLERAVEGFTLDVCHGYLSLPEGDRTFCSDCLSSLGSRIRHIHISDARAPDEEGLQIGDGEIDFSFLGDVSVPILVEVWGGHEHDGRGFRLGIERLRAIERNLLLSRH